MESKIRLMMVDDHPLVRDGFVALLREEIGFDVVAVAESGEEALKKAEQYQPDVILMDVELAGRKNRNGMNGFDATKEIKKLMPEIRVLILSGQVNPSYPMRAQDARASGFLDKTCSHQIIFQSIRTVYLGGWVFPPMVPIVQPRNILTPAETRVFIRMVVGIAKNGKRSGRCTAEMVAEDLKIGVAAVRTHMEKIREKLDRPTPWEMVVYAIKHRLIVDEFLDELRTELYE